MAEKKILYVRGGAVKGIYGGADVVSASIFRILTERFGEGSIRGIFMDELEAPPGRLKSLARALAGRCPTYPFLASSLVAQGAREGARLLFVDQSQYGLACRDAKRANPSIKCAVLFHNVERNYYLRLALKGHAPHNLILLPSVVRAERTAARMADLVIALSERDAREIEQRYGRRPELVLPPALSDCGIPVHHPVSQGGLSMLFVGSSFPPNRDGVRWFVREVLPRVPGRLIVAGRGFDEFRGELSDARVTVLGFVEDLSSVYGMADCVVSPVFWGSGIKVKTAEAFLYGMPFVGAPEALEGYEAEEAGAILARDAEGFAEALRTLADPDERERRSRAARAYYEKALSYGAAAVRLNAALDEILLERNAP
jgi:polysaccharide biosynthesis protein PslH